MADGDVIGDLFARLVLPSDIKGHLHRFYSITLETAAQQVIELGTRTGVSTCAWLAGVEATDGQLWSCDINRPSVPETVELHPRWSFVLGDDLDEAVIGQAPQFCDVLFIDTSHEEQKTYCELERWTPKVRNGGCIVMHDTGELWTGVRSALKRWLAKQPVPLKIERYEHDHGLTVIWP